MLEFYLYNFRCDMIFKIVYRSKFNKNHFKFSGDFQRYITFGKTQDPRKMLGVLPVGSLGILPVLRKI
jgi:hypothetical protein